MKATFICDSEKGDLRGRQTVKRELKSVRKRKEGRKEGWKGRRGEERERRGETAFSKFPAKEGKKQGRGLFMYIY